MTLEIAQYRAGLEVLQLEADLTLSIKLLWAETWLMAFYIDTKWF